MNEMDLAAAESKAKYEEIKVYVKEKTSLQVRNSEKNSHIRFVDPDYGHFFISTVPSAPESFPMRFEDSQLCLPQVHPALADYQDLLTPYP